MSSSSWVCCKTRRYLSNKWKKKTIVTDQIVVSRRVQFKFSPDLVPLLVGFFDLIKRNNDDSTTTRLTFYLVWGPLFPIIYVLRPLLTSRRQKYGAKEGRRRRRRRRRRGRYCIPSSDLDILPQSPSRTCMERKRVQLQDGSSCLMEI